MKNNIPWDLIISKLRRNLSEENEIQFNDWVETGNNRDLFLQIETVWNNAQEKSAGYEPDLEYYWKKLSSRIRQDTTPKKTFLKVNFKYFSRIAAAVIFVALLFTYYIKEHNLEKQDYVAYSTVGNNSRIFLPDSSEIILHDNTILSYCFNKKSNRREVNITGEAYFKVRHDKQIPFLVNANDVSIQVHGTEFNVHSYSSDNKILVSLVNGSISMNTSSDKNIFLKPGEEALYDKDTKTLSVTKGDVDLTRIWTGDKIRLENKDLQEACKYLSKWYGVNIKIDPDIVENQSYTFTVMGQPLTEIIEIMSSINSFDYHFINENELVLKQKK